MPTIIQIPEDLAGEIDRLAQAESKPRTDYIVDLLWQDVRCQKQRQALRHSSGAWNPAEHPELADGGAAYVSRIRSEADQRFEAALRNER